MNIMNNCEAVNMKTWAKWTFIEQPKLINYF